MQKPPHQKSYTFLKHIPKRKVLAFHSIPKLEKKGKEKGAVILSGYPHNLLKDKTSVVRDKCAL